MPNKVRDRLSEDFQMIDLTGTILKNNFLHLFLLKIVDQISQSNSEVVRSMILISIRSMSNLSHIIVIILKNY